MSKRPYRDHWAGVSPGPVILPKSPDEPAADPQLAIIWHMGKFAETRAKKHVHRVLALAGLPANTPAARQAIDAITRAREPHA